MSEYFKYEALDIPDKPATEVLKSKGLDLDFTPRQYQFIPELNTGDFHINGLNLDGYFSINKAKEPVQYKYTQLKLNHNTPSKNKQILEQTLDKYGMVRAKSLILEFPKQLDEKLFFDFLRGYYDGDGSIYDARGYCQISIVGTQNFCEYVQQVLLEKYNIETIVDYCYNKEKSTRNLRIYKQKDVIPFLHYIYKDAHLYLKRKHDIYISKYCSE